MTEDIEFENMLRAYAAPVADNGFSAAAIERAQQQAKWRVPILATASSLGAMAALSQVPALWTLLAGLTLPVTSPFVITSLGVLGFVGWAALDRGWSDAV